MLELVSLPKLKTLRIERQHGIRYIDVGTWKLLARQIMLELENFVELKELEIVTPETKTITAIEKRRMEDLEKVDEMLREAVSRKRESA